MKVELTQELLKEYVSYNEATGELTWIQRPSRNSCCKVGDRVGSITVNNTYQASIFKSRYYVSNLIWLYVHGYLPSKHIIHLDGNGLNDKLINLEEKYTIDLNTLDQKQLHLIFDYNPLTGIVVRKVSLGSGFNKGSVAGSLHRSSGYRRIFIQGKSFDEHLLIWVYMTGEVKEDLVGFEVDHENRVRSDNRWSNLRKASRNQNQHNASLRVDNSSGTKGMIFHNNCYRCQVDCNNIKYIKYFSSDNKDIAIAWLEVTRLELHKEFTHHGN
jgi:hypothetical protein